MKAVLGTQANIGATVSDSEAMQPPGKHFTPPAVDELARFFPQLDIIELIGRGGMGAVYKARQKQLDRLVALKILPPGLGNEAGFAERFTREARALAKLSHPGIVTVHDFGQADGLFYLVMEYVDGVTLRQLLNVGRVEPREALAIVPQICDALQYAHDQGIVHRDIKPENILLDRQGRVKVADFGLAKLVGLGEEQASQAGSATASPILTEAGRVMGTPQYMAPEQRNRPAEVDHRADIYSLGVVFYQMLTGELPAGSIAPPSRKVHIDVRLDEVVLKALENEPQRRYQQAGAFKTQVETIAATALQQAEANPAARPGRRRYASLLTAVGALVVLGAAYVAIVANHTLSPSVQRRLLNPGMEEGDTVPAHWLQGEAIDGVDYLWDKATAHAGKASLQIHKTVDRFFPIAQWSQTVNREGNRPTLQITAQVKADGVTKAVIDVLFLDRNDQWLGHQWIAYIGASGSDRSPVTHDWKAYSGRTAIPENAEKIQIGLQVYGPGKVWFDDVEAEYLDSTPLP